MANSYNELMGIGGHSEDAALEGWWLLNDNAASTAVDDRSSNNRNGTLVGGVNTQDIDDTGPTTWLPKSLRLNGSNQYITTPYTGADVELTCAVRFNRDNNSNPQVLVGRNDDPHSSGDWAAILFNDMSRDWVAFTYDTDFRHVATLSEPSHSAWHDAIVARSASALNFYTDGSAVASAASFSGSGGSDAFWIGAREYAGFNWPFDGAIADVVLFSREWTSGERSEWRAGPEPVVTSGSDTLDSDDTEGSEITLASEATYGLPSPFSSGTNGTITYSYQWTRSTDNTGTGEADIGGATSATYTPDASDVGYFLRRRRRASNNGGYDSAADTNSDFSGEIQAAGGSIGRGLLNSPKLSRLSLVG